MRSTTTARAKRLDARRRATRFFADNAGGVVGQAALTGYRLALAEELAERCGWTVEWEIDTDVDTSWCEECESDSEHRAEHVADTYCATLLDAEGKSIHSTGGIDRPTSAYRRVVEAELAADALLEDYTEPDESRESFLRKKADAAADDADRQMRTRAARLVTAPHGRCANSTTCVEHEHNPRIPTCKKRTGRVRPR